MAKIVPFTANNVSTPDAITADGPCGSIMVLPDPTDANYATAEYNAYEPGASDGPARMEPGRAYTFKKRGMVDAGVARELGYQPGEVGGFVESVGVATLKMLKIEI